MLLPSTPPWQVKNNFSIVFYNKLHVFKLLNPSIRCFFWSITESWKKADFTMPPVDNSPRGNMGGFELVYSMKTNDTVPIHIYKSTNTGITVCIAEVEGPVVCGYFCLGRILYLYTCHFSSDASVCFNITCSKLRYRSARRWWAASHTGASYLLGKRRLSV